ncbi:DVU_1556 family methyltransferase [Nitratidesulfovibrio sp. D1]|uniref:DVU_1556 family methyltransferase n=1 Tax=Nitratidesulfovibrio sp. D1 TaxID=3440151 RepID=UPI003EBCB8D3
MSAPSAANALVPKGAATGTGPWEHPALRAVAGATLRPGGLALTRRALELAARLAGLPQGARVADVGCGPGETVALLRERGLTAVGLDLSASLLAEARGRDGAMPLIRADAGANTEVGLPLRTASLDGAFCECVLSVLPGRQAVLAELARALRPGGVLAWSDLYARDGRPAGARRGADGGEPRCSAPSVSGRSCLTGAIPRAAMEGVLQRTGFTVLAFEDHSRLLAELAGRLLFAGAGLAELFGCGGGGGGRPGYALLLARRNGPAQGEPWGDAS